MSATIASIGQAAQAFLEASEAALATTTRGPVTRAWLNPGQPAFDVQCDFVCVWMGGENLAPGGAIPTSQQFRTGPRINLVTLYATTGRCVAVGTATRPPSDDEKTADALVQMEDGQALWNYVGAAISAGDLFDGTCRQISLQGMTAYTPQGGFAGFNLAALVQIDGYPVTF